MHQVGAGVLGPVFRAYDPDTERTLALKSFPLDLTPEQAGRLASGLARLATLDLSHPSLIVPIAAGSEGSTAYLVEEYFIADSVDIALRQYGPAPVPDAVRLIGQLAGGLDFAAAVGVHHGALHPRDVLVAPRDVRLTGIGVAQALESVGFRLQPRRHYSAPERAEPGEWGVAADVYSLAALAYELLTGRRPTASGDTLTIEPQAVPASDTAALAEVFARAFSVAPGDRFPSALAFAAGLKHALTGQPLDAVGEGERSRSRRGRSAGRKAAMLPLDEPELQAPPPTGTPEAPIAAAPVPTPEPPAVEAPSPEPPVPAPVAPPEEPPPVMASAPEPEPPSAAESSSTQLPAETTDVREALLAGEPELPAPPPALDDLDLRPREAEAPLPPANELYEFEPEEAPPEEPRLADVAAESEPAPEHRVEAPSVPPADARRRRALDEPEFASPRLTPAYRPLTPPRHGSRAATMLIVALMAIALAIAGGYYAASRYLGGATQAPASTTPSAPAADSGGVSAPQGQVPTPSLETLPPEPSLPAAEPKGTGAPAGATAPGATAPSAASPTMAPERTTPSTAAPAPAPGRPAGGAAGDRAAGAAAKPGAAKTPTRAAKPKPAAPPPARASAAPSTRARSTVFEGSLSIASRPAGARVFLDGHPVGTTPMTLTKVSAGSHVVRLQIDGYATWSGAIQVAAGESNRVTASLDHLPR